MNGSCLIWLAASALISSPTYGPTTPEGRGWTPEGGDPETIPQCGKTTDIALPAGWKTVDCRMGNLFLRNDRLGAEIRLHAMMPDFDYHSDPALVRERVEQRLLRNLMIRERRHIVMVRQHPGYESLALPEQGSCELLPPDAKRGDGPNSRRYAVVHDNLEFRGRLAAKQQVGQDGRPLTDWLAVGRWPAGQDAAALRDFQVIFDSVRWR